jgi:hypothetical protein
MKMKTLAEQDPSATNREDYATKPIYDLGVPTDCVAAPAGERAPAAGGRFCAADGVSEADGSLFADAVAAGVVPVLPFRL